MDHDLERRAGAGEIAAQLELADRCDAAGHPEAATRWLGAAARQGSLTAIAQLGARTVVGAGCTASPADGRALLEFAAKSGSALALRHLAVLDLSEGHAERGLQHARAAAQAGDEDLAAQLADLGPEDALLADQSIETLCHDPPIARLPGALSERTCAALIAWCEPVLARAETIDRQSGLARIDAARTNRFARLGLFDQPLELLLFKLRLARLVGQPVAHFEGTNILAYDPGQSFAVHHDFLDPAEPGFTAELATRGQRVATVLVALYGDYSGGETAFPQLDLAWRGRTGEGLWFGNLDAAGAPDRRTLHEGRPPSAGRKWLLSQWIRDRAQPPG